MHALRLAHRYRLSCLEKAVVLKLNAVATTVGVNGLSGAGRGEGGEL